MITPRLLELLHMSNVFGQTAPMLQPQIPPIGIGNVLPAQGGIPGRMPFPQQVPEQQIPIQPMQPYAPIPEPTYPEFKPETRMGEAFTQGVGQMPLRENFKPSGMRKLAGVVAGLGAGSPASAYQTSSGIMDAPFIDASSDWATKQDLLTKAATIEDAQNRNQENAGISKYGKDVSLRGQKVIEQNNLMKNEVAKKANEIRAAVAKDKNWVLDTDETGKYILINKATGQKVNTGVRSDTPGFEEMERIKQEHAIERIKQQGTESQETKATAPGENTKYIIRQDETGQFVLIPTTPGKGAATGTGTMGKPTGVNSQVPTQQKAALANAITKAQITHSDGFVYANGKITTTLKKPGSAWTKAGNDAIDAARQRVEDEFKKIGASSTTAPKPDPLGIR